MSEQPRETTGDELVPDWSDVPVDDTPEPEGDPHEGDA